MKHTWLLFGCSFLVLRWTNILYIQLIFLLFVILFYYKHYVFHKMSIVVFIVLFISCLPPKQIDPPISKTVQVKQIRSGYIIANNGEQDVVLYNVNDVGFDDILTIKGEYTLVDSIHNIRSFSFATWLQRRGIYYQINVKDSGVVKEGTSLRHQLYQRIQSIQDKEQKRWVNAMLFGIHEDEMSFFITSSGMHISYIFMFIEKLFLMVVSKTTASLLVLMGIGICGYASVFSSSLLRVLCFRLVKYVFFKSSNDDVIGMSMFLILLLFPYMAFEMAFLLPVAFRLIQLFNIQARKRRLTGYCVLVPMQFLYFHTCNPIQIFLFSYLRIVYAMLYLLCWLLAFLPWSFLLAFSLWIYSILQYMETLSFTLYYTPSIGWLLLWLLWVCRYISIQGKKPLSVLCLLLLYAPYASYFDPFAEVVMLDVGQGDCTIIRLPFHQGVVMIDVMGSLYKNVPEDIIVPALRSMGIHSIDKLIITHEDYDHSGGYAQLKALVPIEEVIKDKREHTNVGSLNIPFVLSTYQGSDENDDSIITYMDLYGIRFLFMGDAGSKVEEKLLETYPNMNVDVLKVGHHGSNTSSSQAFLHSIQPQVALISAGRNNRYGHPHKETLQRLEDENIYPLINAKSGAVSIKICKYFAFFKTANNEFGIIKNR